MEYIAWPTGLLSVRSASHFLWPATVGWHTPFAVCHGSRLYTIAHCMFLQSVESKVCLSIYPVAQRRSALTHAFRLARLGRHPISTASSVVGSRRETEERPRTAYSGWIRGTTALCRAGLSLSCHQREKLALYCSLQRSLDH